MNKLLIHEEPLQVLPSLAAKIGLNEAIMLQQIHYWLRKSKNIRDGKPWIYNTYTEWEKQFPWWSNRTIKRIVDNLRAAGLIETTSKYNKLNIDQTLWYTINYDKLDIQELADSASVPESDKMAQSDSATSAESDKMSLPKVPTCHNGGDKMAQSAPVAESDKLALPLPRDIQENTTREKSECAQDEAPQPATPSPLPLSAHSSGSTGDRNMDAAKAKFERGGRVASSWQAELNLELSEKIRVPLAKELARVSGWEALINAGDDGKNRECHEAAIYLYKMGIGTPADLKDWYAVYLSDPWHREKNANPKPEKVKELISKKAQAKQPGMVQPKSNNGNGAKPAGVYVGVAENLK
jgi:hypothetical protein